MSEYSLELIGRIVFINELHISILEKLKLVCHEIYDYFDLEAIVYFSYKNSLKKELSIPEHYEFSNEVSEKVFIRGEWDKLSINDIVVVNIPIRDSFYIYGAIQIFRNKSLNPSEGKLLNLISHLIGSFINLHRINESINERLKNLNIKSGERESFNEIFFNMHVELLSKMLSSRSKLNIFKYFAVYLKYNPYISIDEGIFYKKEEITNNFIPIYFFNYLNEPIGDFSDELKRVESKNFDKDALKKFPVCTGREDLIKYFRDRYVYSIEINKRVIGYFISNTKVSLIKVVLKLLAICLEHFEKTISIRQLHKGIKEVENRIFQSNFYKNYGEIINQISHEIKNPLIAIAGFSKRLVKYIDEKEKPDYSYIKERMKIILNECIRLENLLHDLVVFNRVDNPVKRKFSLYSVVKKTINLFKPLMEEKQIEVIFNYKKTPFIHGDPEQIRQLLYNLILNSYEASNTGGRINIELFPGSKNVILEISDNAGGIPEKMIQNIFNPFFTTKIKGSGLGLAIVYKIVKNHNGEIKVKNQDKGVKFTIKLPIGGTDEEKNINNR